MTFMRQLSSRFTITDFGVERLPDGSYILFQLGKPQMEEKVQDIEKFLAEFSMFSELSPKSAELFQILGDSKKSSLTPRTS